MLSELGAETYQRCLLDVLSLLGMTCAHILDSYWKVVQFGESQERGMKTFVLLEAPILLEVY